MIYFQIEDGKGKILAGNMEDFPRKHEFENRKNFTERNTEIKSVSEYVGKNLVWIIIEDEPDLFKSSKLFKKTLQIYKNASISLHKNYKKEIEAYSHMLKTVQAQMRQKIDAFVDEITFQGDTYRDSVDRIANAVKEDASGAADLICYLQKRVIDMKAQLLGSEVIHSGGTYDQKIVRVSLRRAILNQYTPFIEELDENNVSIKFLFDDTCEIDVDKNLFSLIMYNFFSNALKYCKPNSEIRLKYNIHEKTLAVSMISLKMDRQELIDLQKEGVRGAHASHLPGNGIGLFVINKSLSLMGKQNMYILPAYEKSVTENGITYIENHFNFFL